MKQNPEKFQELVNAMLRLLTQANIDIKVIEEATEILLNQFDIARKQENVQANIVHSKQSIGKQLAEFGRDQIGGQYRFGLKKGLEEVADQKSEVMKEMYAEFLRNPRKLSLFMRSWEIGGDDNWKSHVLKVSPQSYAILSTWYDQFQKKLGIKFVGSDTDFEVRFQEMQSGKDIEASVMRIREVL